MQSPVLSLSNPPALSKQLEWRTNQRLSGIIKANHISQFAKAAPELAEFRRATAGGLVDGMDDGDLCQTFRKTVQFTSYDAYAPFIARLLEKPCKASAIRDLLAPGIPDSIWQSSSTSGGVMKAIPKYNVLPEMKSLGAGSWAESDPLRRRTKASVVYIGCEPIYVEDEDSRVVATIYAASGSAIYQRMVDYLDPEKDGEKMGTIILDRTAPYAAGFVEKWRPFLLIHALFAVSSRSLETIETVFMNTFVDMIRQLDMHFDVVVDCIANGTIPELDGIAEVRHYLESNVSPDLERAAELRRLGRPSSRPGWCGLAWPNLRSIITISTGSFASSVPLARWFLGPGVEFRSVGYHSTEASIALGYCQIDLNLFKIVSETIVEFLDISQSDSINALVQPWEVEPGRRYEVVVTNEHGLWRYRQGDVVEVSGFDPVDGVPVVQFIERRNVAMRFPEFMVTEEELRAAVLEAFSSEVVEWTTTVDDQFVPATIGFFVELAREDQGASDSSLAPDRILDSLARLNKNVAWAVTHDCVRRPSVRLVRPGTFSEFRQLKLDEGSRNVGQVKVPVVLPKAAYVAWFVDRVAEEV